MEINHALINWDLVEANEISKNAKTLILGSFNPNKPNPNENTNFYYGRNTNHFWKSISRNLNLPENYFFENNRRKLDCMSKYEFCFFYLINSIDFICNDNEVLNQYVNDKIFTTFDDTELFKVRPFNYQNNPNIIHKNVNFNHHIFEFLEDNKISKVIHTLGNNRIDLNLVAKPVNNNLGFTPFVNQIIEICNNNQIEFIATSYSPSQTAVNRGGVENLNNLDAWIAVNVLNINQ